MLKIILLGFISTISISDLAMEYEHEVTRKEFTVKVDYKDKASDDDQERKHNKLNVNTKKSNTFQKKRGRKLLPIPVEGCLHCSAKTTPEWRSGPSGKRTLCNACGLNYRHKLKKQKHEKECGIDRADLKYIINKEESK
jgi:hypothetical protein